MYPWRTRLAHIHVPGEPQQWCLDDGKGDLIACGSGEPGKERAHKLAETLNMGHAVRASGINQHSVMNHAKAIYDKCQEIDLSMQQIFGFMLRSNPKVADLNTRIGELQNAAAALQGALLA